VRWATLPAVALAAVVTVGAQAPPDIDTLLARVSARVEQYYKRAQQIVCTEKATVQPISRDYTPAGFARTTESELRVESETAADGDNPSSATVVRQLLKVNGRPPRDRDKTDRAGCTDPNPLSAEPLAFLLPANRQDYTFTPAGFGKGKDRGSLIIEFLARSGDEGKLVENKDGREDCFSISIPGAMRGRVWVDANTYEVLRMEQHIGLGDIRVGFAEQRKHNLPPSITVERYDTTTRYKPIAFRDPEEAMLLPESIETVVVWRNGMESTRRRQDFSDYRRFLTGGRIVK
jgi:hypothetical protein